MNFGQKKESKSTEEDAKVSSKYKGFMEEEKKIPVTFVQHNEDNE